MDAADEEELRELRGLVSAHLEWELAIGGTFLERSGDDEPQQAPVAAAPEARERPRMPQRERSATPPDVLDPSAGAAGILAALRGPLTGVPSTPREPAVRSASSPGTIEAPRESPRPSAPASVPSAPVMSAGPTAPVGDKGARLRVLTEEAAACTDCRLHSGRTKSVFSRGSEDATIAFVGEGPGFHEDQQGLPFVGPAGQLLDRMIGAMGTTRDDVYVCNVVKCRPPDNRTPLPDEAGACARFLVPQLELVAPRVIVALGRCAAENLGCAEEGRSWRGVWGSWRGIPVMPTYHPAYLLRTPEAKRVVWDDLQKVMQRLGMSAPKRGGGE